MKRVKLWKLLVLFSLVIGALVIFVTNHQFVGCFTNVADRLCLHLAKTEIQTVQLIEMPLSSSLTPATKTANTKKSIAVSQEAQMFLLILIMSAPYKTERRVAIRQTWLSTLTNNSIQQVGKHLYVVQDPADVHKQLVVSYHFVCGHYRDVFHKVEPAVEEEVRTYGDILRLELNETYERLVFKTLAALKYAATINTQFVLKIDDDVYLNVPRLLWWLRTSKVPDKLYAGDCPPLSPIIRDKQSKYFVSYEQLKGKYFPPYCNGPFYLLSKNVIPVLLNVSKASPPFPVEDAYIGTLAAKIGLNTTQLRHIHVLVEPTLPKVEKNWNDTMLLRHFLIGHNLPIERLFSFHARYTKLKRDYMEK